MRPSSLGTAAATGLVLLVAGPGPSPLTAQDARPSFYEPGISPDGAVERLLARIDGGG